MNASKRIISAMSRIHLARSILAPSVGIGCATGYLEGLLQHKKTASLNDIAAAMECGAKHAESHSTAIEAAANSNSIPREVPGNGPSSDPAAPSSPTR